MNHFRKSSVCKKSAASKVNAVDESYCSDSSSCESINVVSHVISSVGTADQPIYCEMMIKDKKIKFQVDCGATVNILPRYVIGEKEIRPEPVNLQMWNKSNLKSLGKCKVKAVNPANNKKYRIDFVIVEENLTPLLSRKAAEAMQLITVNYGNFEQVHSVSSLSTYVQQFSEVFSTLPGVLPGGPVYLTVKQGAEPVIKPARTIPESLKDPVKSELDRLALSGIISPVENLIGLIRCLSLIPKMEVFESASILELSTSP